MSKLNVFFEVPKWIDNGVNSGNFKIFGGVIRDNRGQIIHHLQKATLDYEKNNPRLKILLAVVVIAGTLYLIYKLFYKKEKEIMTSMEHAVEPLAIDYCNKITTKELTLEDIDRLLIELSKIKSKLQQKEYKDVKLYLSNEKYNLIKNFVESVEAVNKSLVKNNNIKFTIPDQNNQMAFKPMIIDLFEQLETQKKIYMELNPKSK